MATKHIIDSRLFIRLDLSNALLINQDFAQNSKNKTHFASQLLLYDKIVIPTTDFGIVPILISWFGLTDFEKALDSGALQFLRRDGLLAYNGGLGIGLIRIEKGIDTHFDWWQEVLFGKDDLSLEIQLTKNDITLSKRQQNSIIQKILENTTHLDFGEDLFMESIVKESYTDIMKSPSLIEMVKKHGKKRPDGSINLERLEEVPSNQTRVLRNDGQLTDIADLVLRVAEINMEIVMAAQTQNADLFTSQGADNLLRQKLIRSKVPQKLLNGFFKVLDLTKTPDIRPAVEKEELTLSEIWKVRNSTKGKRFREWLREADTKSARDLEREYVEAISQNTLADSLPLRTMRFIITSLTGVLNPIVGLGTSVVDSFFLDKWLSGFSPKLFLDELQKLIVNKTSRR